MIEEGRRELSRVKLRRESTCVPFIERHELHTAQHPADDVRAWEHRLHQPRALLDVPAASREHSAASSTSPEIAVVKAR